MTYIYWAFAVIVLVYVTYYLIFMILEVVHPFTYRRVPLSDIHNHVRALFRRGLNCSQMLITNEENGKRLYFRKGYRYGQKGFLFHAIVQVGHQTEVTFLDLIQSLKVMGVDYRVCRNQRNAELNIDCKADLDTAYAVADVMLSQILNASNDTTFSVRVKGRMLDVDGCVGGETTIADMGSMFRQAARSHKTEPAYNWRHHRSRTMSLGDAIGRVVAAIFRPRNMWR